MSKFTNKQTVDAILWDSQSMDVAQLHEKYGIKKATLRAMLYRNGLKPRKPDPTRFVIPKEKLETVLSNGWMNVQDLAQALDCSYATVLKSLKFHGIVRGRKPTVRHRLREGNRAFKILGCLINNPEMDYQTIAHKFICTRELVGQIAAMARKEGIIK